MRLPRRRSSTTAVLIRIISASVRTRMPGRPGSIRFAGPARGNCGVRAVSRKGFFMPSHFPGMDPYLEDPGRWPDVHHGVISQMQAEINRTLRPKYSLRVQNRVYISDENDPGRQVNIPEPPVAHTRQGGSPSDHGITPAPAVAAVAEPVDLTTLIEDEIHEARLEVIDHEHRLVVTVIEILSPTNKVSGSRGRESYLQQRTEVMKSPSHFVELDLLRDGVSLTARELLPPADYYLHVSRSDRRPKSRVWPILLPQRLPAVPIALRPEDGEAP